MYIYIYPSRQVFGFVEKEWGKKKKNRSKTNSFSVKQTLANFDSTYPHQSFLITFFDKIIFVKDKINFFRDH